MKTFKDYKYTFVHLKDSVLAISTYAGKTVKGIAKCDPKDDFDPVTGEKIAAARCNLKVSKRRVSNAKRKLKDAIQKHYEAEQYLMKMTDYYNDSQAAVIEAEAELKNILANS